MLEIKNLSAGYGSGDVIHDISFTVKDGERVCIIGPNGCGKSTLLKAICGILQYKGSIRLDGEEAEKISRRKRAEKIAYLPQISATYFDYTVYEAIKMSRYSKMGFFTHSDAEGEKIVKRCIEKLGLQDIAHKSIAELSGGQLQRVYLARTLAQEPQTIMLDEPTNHLDVKYKLELVEIMKDWANDGKHSVIGVIHDIGLAASLATRAILIKDGYIVYDGLITELIKSNLVDEVYEANVRAFMKESFELWS